jgi:hypothetical protein
VLSTIGHRAAAAAAELSVTCKRSTAHFSRDLSRGRAMFWNISSHLDLHSSGRYRRFVAASPFAPSRRTVSRRASVAWRSCASAGLCRFGACPVQKRRAGVRYRQRAGPAALAWARRSHVPTSRDDQDRRTRCMASGTPPPQGSSCAPPRHVHASICLTKMTTGRNFSISGSNKHVTWIYLCRMERSA